MKEKMQFVDFGIRECVRECERRPLLNYSFDEKLLKKSLEQRAADSKGSCLLNLMLKHCWETPFQFLNQLPLISDATKAECLRFLIWAMA